MINLYLKSLLAENKRVIIPDFGGFVVKRSAAGDIISFNSFLKFNDDLLANVIVEKEGVDKPQALQQIQEYVKLINISLDDTGRFEIVEVGFIIKDKKGNIRYVDQVEAGLSEVNPVVIEDKKVNDTVPSKAHVNKRKPVADDKVESLKSEKAPMGKDKRPVVVKDEKKSSKIWIIAIVLVLIFGAWAISRSVSKKINNQNNTELVEGHSDTESVKQKLAEQHDKVVEKKANDQMSVQSTSEKKGFFARLFSKKKEEVVTAKPVVVKTKVEYFMQPNQADTINGFLVIADKNISAKGMERYNVIVGSFSKKKNAVAYNKQLRYDVNASQIFERYNGYTAVSLGAYPTLDIAIKVCEEKLRLTPDVWILIK